MNTLHNYSISFFFKPETVSHLTKLIILLFDRQRLKICAGVRV